MVRRFLAVVPRGVQTWAWITIGCALLIGVAAGYHAAEPGTAWRSMLGFGAGGLAAGFFLAAWMLSLGYVYADARRRNMRAVPWTLVAALVPHLLGFLLYFVLRAPLAVACPQCGEAVSVGQRYCPACGAAQTVPAPPGARPGWHPGDAI